MNNLEHYLTRIDAIAEIIADAATEAEQQCQLPSAVLSALHDAALFRLLLPQPFGGAELSPVEFCQIIMAVARIDASTAWCLCQANGCAMSAAYLKPEVADEIWGQDQHAVLAWGPGIKATALDCGDHYRVSGRWSFASGCRHASWLGAQASILHPDRRPKHADDGEPLIRTLLIPASAVELQSDWDVIGLRATGSDSYRLDDYPVRREYAVTRDAAAERRYQTALYLFPAMSLYASGFAATALGIADTLLTEFQRLASDKKPRLARQPLRDNAVVQNDVALAQIRLSAARTYLLHELQSIWETVSVEQTLGISQRMRIRLATTHAIHEAKWVADTLYDLAGASAIFKTSPFERRFRDLHTVTQQLQGRKSHYQTVGAYLLGQAPDLSVI